MKISSSVKNNNIEIDITAGGRYLNDHVRQYRLGLTFELLNHFIENLLDQSLTKYMFCSISWKGLYPNARKVI